MNESHINRINELLGESVIYESVKKKTKIKLSLDDGSKKEMDFDGSLNDAKKKYSGKKVKTIRKSKSGDIIGEAVIVGVEELNETKELIPFGYFKITYSDGSSKKTEARAKTAEDFKKYLTQDGNDVVTDENEDGKETKKKIVKVEKLDESATSEGKVFNGVLLKKLLNNPNKIGIDDWRSKDGVPGFVIYVSKYPSYHKMITKAIDKETLNDIEDELLKSIDGKIWKADEFRSFIKDDKDLNGKVILVDFINDEDEPVVIFKNLETGKEFSSHKPMTSEKLKTYLLGKLAGKNMSESLEESMDTEVHTFETPMDMFRQIVKESQAIYIKEKNGKIEGRYNPKPKKDWVLVDGFTASKAVQLYKAATEDQKAKIDKLSLTRLLNAIWKTKKVNESEETKESFKVNKALIVSESLPQYFETMLWSSTDMDSGEPLDKEYDVKDISKALKDSSKKDLLSFAEYCEKECSKELEEYLEEEGYSSFGHDMWLSRNGHGAGFFGRGNGYKALQKASKTFGSVDPMVNKGKIVA